jgi:hypothetical protein
MQEDILTPKWIRFDIIPTSDTTVTEYFVESGQEHVFTAKCYSQPFYTLKYEHSISSPTVTDYQVVTKQRTVYKSLMEIILGS